jgi:hypothetical protein
MKWQATDEADTSEQPGGGNAPGDSPSSESGQEEDKIKEEGEELEASVKSNEATSADEMIRSTVKEMIKDDTNSTEKSTSY